MLLSDSHDYMNCEGADKAKNMKKLCAYFWSDILSDSYDCIWEDICHTQVGIPLQG